jgi:hypothetical protein
MFSGHDAPSAGVYAIAHDLEPSRAAGCRRPNGTQMTNVDEGTPPRST